MFRSAGRGLSLAAFALVTFAGIGAAQTKVVVINLQRAVLESAEIKAASAAMEAKYKPQQDQLNKLAADLQKLQTEIQGGKLTPQQEADKQAEGQRKQREAQRLQQDLQESVERERQEILGKAGQKMQDVVKKLAEASGYDVVVDISNTVYHKPALEITDAALAAYNKAYPSAAAAPAK